MIAGSEFKFRIAAEYANIETLCVYGGQRKDAIASSVFAAVFSIGNDIASSKSASHRHTICSGVA